jgi:hypothetical protein
VAGALLILGALALAAHSREQKAKPANSTFPDHIVLDASSHCNYRFGFVVALFVGLRNTGDVDRQVDLTPWRRLSNNVISYPARAPWTVKVPAHTMKMFLTEGRIPTQGGTVHLVQCGVILNNDINHIHHLNITHASSLFPYHGPGPLVLLGPNPPPR